MSENLTLINPEKIHLVNAGNFENIALQVFNYQYQNNAVYRDFCNALRILPQKVDKCVKIPFLPISFFKTHTVISGEMPPHRLYFESSGTSASVNSRHFVPDTAFYDQSLLRGFQQFYGDPARYAILALLPSYLERKNASLVYMAQSLMHESGHPQNGFYINEWQKLYDTLVSLGENHQKVLLIGVTFALLDFAEAFPANFSNMIVMETGGMKGRRHEMTRTEVHDFLKNQWQLQEVHSEYGMTELLSQAYALSGGIFRCTETMRVLVRDVNDPLEVTETGYGCLNVIDLANVNSCSFIATEDLGHVYEDRSFEVLGRMDHSALRGCSLMAV